MKKALKIVLIVIGVIALLYGGIWVYALIPSPTFEPASYDPKTPDYWPTDGWRTSSPEQQGMDSSKLLELHDFYGKAHEKDPNNSIDAVSVYRNGYLVADYYFNPLYPRETQHVIHSCTKSILSALVGIAVDQGYIDSVDDPFVTYFPDQQYAITDEKMRDITIRDLLSMETGIRSRDYAIYRWEGLFAMLHTDDWVAYALSLPVDADPGERYDYSNISSFLLSAIVHNATGMDTLAFARENLFNPLGISEVRWNWSPQGYAVGFARMWLLPEDMAKFGMLYLQKGRWDGEQIIPEWWITESLTPHAYPKNFVYVLDENGERDQQLTSIQWQGATFVRPFTDGYGYQWWLDKDGSYSAVGVSGQYIMVVPQENLVVVVNNSSVEMGVFFPRKLLNKIILPAIKSDDAISANDVAYQELLTRSGPPALASNPVSVSELPDIALAISGATYGVEENNFNFDNFQLVFNPEWDYAEFSYTANVNDVVAYGIGLDGVYHFTETDNGTWASYGSWTAPDTFEINSVQIGYSAPSNFVLTFSGDEITVQEVGVVGIYIYNGIKK